MPRARSAASVTPSHAEGNTVATSAIQGSGAPWRRAAAIGAAAFPLAAGALAGAAGPHPLAERDGTPPSATTLYALGPDPRTGECAATRVSGPLTPPPGGPHLRR